MAESALALSGVTKRFPGVTALADVSLALMPGDVHAIMGENGAGKSTLMKIAAGIHRPDGGALTMEGAPVRFANPAQASLAGVRTVFQELTVLPNLTVAENLLIGREPVKAGGLWLDKRSLLDEARTILDRLRIPIDVAARAGGLSAGQRQMIEIARACATLPKVLILDEPTSSLGRQEEEVLFALVRRLRDEGVAIAYITHRMSEVFMLSDTISVLRDGRHIVTGPADGFTRASLISAMVGRAVDERATGMPKAGAPLLLSARNLSRGRAVRGVSLDLHAGEVLGVAGLMGAGRTELARLIAGIDKADAGTMVLAGLPFAPADVADAMQAGVVYLSEDRKVLGLVLALSVGDNITLPSLRRLAPNGILPKARLDGLAAQWMARLGVKANSVATGVSTLSGGNQQKVAIAKWLATDPKVILLDEPTRGVDVGAKAEIYALIRQLAADGAAVMVISSELPEVLQVSDRIAVMARGCR
ncbi:MAG: sugar ABC transporter ATP-binding protein [Rhizobiaceae bacterium]|nr:sugar ABC transporter ATP-binding protein [Rhizobiaceae bacterium]